MVFVVIFSMVSFVIGYTGLQLFFSFFGGGRQVIGTFDGGTLRASDFRTAQGELTLLRMLQADAVLMAQGQQGLAGPLLVHQLFPDSQYASDLALRIKEFAQSGQAPVDLDAVDAFFSERTQPEIMWMLLKAEAANAGCRVSDTMASNLLMQILPQLARGADAAETLKAIAAQAHMTEDQLVRTFAELLGIIFYVGNITDSQAVTLNQIEAAIGRSQERFDAEFVKIPADWFIQPDSPVSSAQLQQQFDTYKNVYAGTVSDDNPFGFGYHLPKRVRLEYMAVLLDDVKTLIERPSAEQMEDYYSRNIDQFRYEEPADPAAPEGEKVTQTRSFAEALPQIRNRLEQERIMRRANEIFNDARAMTERGFSAINLEEAESEQLRAAAGDYVAAATELSGRHKITVLTGTTGSLSAEHFAKDGILRGLRLPQGDRTVLLSEVVFAAESDPQAARRRIGVPAVRPWENIGPMVGGYFDEAAGKFHRLMTMVRITAIEDPSVPASIDMSYSVRGMVLMPSQQTNEKAETILLSQRVADDVRRAAAMEVAQARARHLAAMIGEKGWEAAIEAFNTEYADELGANKAALETVRQQMRLSAAEIERTRSYVAANPASASYFQTRVAANVLNERLYGLLADGEPSTGEMAEVLDVKKSSASYIVKGVTRQPAAESDYLENKVMTAMQLKLSASADLALFQLKPQNLFERMNYVGVQTPIAEPQAPILPPPAEGF